AGPHALSFLADATPVDHIAFFDLISVSPEDKPDLAATSPTWNTAQDGVDFGYEVDGAALPQDTTAALYWATGTTEDTILEPATTPIPIPKTTQVGVPQTVHVAPQDFPGGAPPDAKYLLLVVNPSGPNHITESDETNGQDPNNVKWLALPDIVMQHAS